MRTTKAIERIKMIKAMEFLARQINNEDIFQRWLLLGVADGDIPYAQLEAQPDDEINLDVYYADDSSFAEIMDLFLYIMSKAYKSGGLYCNGVVSGTPQTKD